MKVALLINGNLSIWCVAETIQLSDSEIVRITQHRTGQRNVLEPPNLLQNIKLPLICLHRFSLYNSILGAYQIMSGRVVKEVANGARKVSIILAEEVQDKGYKRVIDAIDRTVIAQTVEKVANAFSGSKLMTAG